MKVVRWHSSRVGQAVAGIAIGGGLGWLAIQGIDWGLVAHSLGTVQFEWLLPALLILPLDYYVRARRWHVLFITERISVLRLLTVQMASIGANNLTPIRILRDPLQFGILTLRDGLRGGAVAATIVAERVMDAATNVVIIAAGLLLFPPFRQFLPYLVVTLAVPGLGIALLLAAGARLRWTWRGRRLSVPPAFSEAARALMAHPWRLAVSFALTLLFWVVMGSVGWMVAQAVGIPASLPFMVVIVQAVFLFGVSLPGLPMATGTFHFASVALLGMLGVEQEAAFTYAVLHHLAIFLPPTLVAVIVLPREGIRSVPAAFQMLQRWQQAQRTAGAARASPDTTVTGHAPEEPSPQ